MLPVAAGDVVVQGEDLGRWVTAQRLGWEQLLPVQPWLLENTLKVTPAGEEERPVKRTQDTMWTLNLAAARQFHTCEGHLRVSRKHGEHLETQDALSGRQGGADGAWWPSSGRGSTTPSNALGSSPSNAGQSSMSSACAGRRPGRRTREGAGIRWGSGSISGPAGD